MDLGEFFTLERPVQIILVVGFFLVSRYVTDFLAVRAVGMFLILLAAPLLDAAFLEAPLARLLIVAPAYVWAVAGMFFVGMPYLMRDAIDWVTATPERWKRACGAGVVYGLALLVCGFVFY